MKRVSPKDELLVFTSACAMELNLKTYQSGSHSGALAYCTWNKLYCRLCCSILVIVLVTLLIYKVSDLLPYALLQHAIEKQSRGIMHPLTRSTPVPFFRRPHNFNCYAMIFQNASKERKRAMRTKRPLVNEMEYWTLLQNCTNIYQKFYWSSAPLSIEEENFPLAFSIMMNEDTDHVIRMINALYAPQNLYCVHIDWKAPAIIHDVMRLFASCMPNVIISSKSESVFRDGYTTLQAILNCLSDLRRYQSRYNWKYALTLQGKDFPLRTNREMVDVLTLYDGQNDIELIPPVKERFNWSRGYINNIQGLPVGLKERNYKMPKGRPPANLTIYKGSICAALSYKFVNFLMEHPSSLALQKWLQDTALPDEYLWSTINHNEHLRAPGGYPGSCLVNSHKKKDWVSRYAIWYDTRETDGCSGGWRHSVCLIGADELPDIVRRRHFFVNKFWIRGDPVALDCLHEVLFNRTYSVPTTKNSFSLSRYKNLAPVRFQALSRQFGFANATKMFKC